MDAIIAVHIEFNNQKLREAYNPVGEEIGRVLDQGGKAYYLSWTLSPEETSSEIKKHLDKMEVIPLDMENGNFPVQYLLTKYKLMQEQGLEKVHLTGTSYDACVRDLHWLLTTDPELIDTKRYTYESAATKYLRWDTEKFERVFNHKLNAKIRYKLTNKVLE